MATKKKQPYVSVPLRPEQFKQLEKIAAQEGRSKASQVRFWIVPKLTKP